MFMDIFWIALSCTDNLCIYYPVVHVLPDIVPVEALADLALHTGSAKVPCMSLMYDSTVH